MAAAVYLVEEKPVYDDVLRYVRKVYYEGEENSNFDLYDIMHEFGRPNDALLYLPLFIPEFVEVDGYVLLTGITGIEVEDFIKAKKVHGSDNKEFMKGFNYIELPYQFLDNDATWEGYLILAEMVAVAWRAHLSYRFPGRNFNVFVLSDDDLVTELTVGFEEVT